jgi:oxaloacetate decarboxylase (Na+ extruding) subunit alpha
MTATPESTTAPTRQPVRFVDTSLRDGNQSLWGATGLTTGMVEAVGPHLAQIGLEGIDFTSSTNLLMGSKTHREDPWERISRMHAVAGGVPLSAITTGMRFMSWDRASETVMRLSLRLMARHGLGRLQIADPMNDVPAVKTIAAWAKDEGIGYIVAATTFTESPVHTDDTYVDAARAFSDDPNIDAVYLKDPGGLLTYERVGHLIPALRQAVVDKPLELHSHCTTGEAPQVYMLAAQLGVDVLHTGIGALANGTAQPEMRSVMDNLDALGIPYQADRDAVERAAETIGLFASSQGLPAGQTMPFDLAPHAHQVPGGMMGTLKRQLKELRIEGDLPAVIAETGRVRAELGYPIMVTPFSQFVGSQALMNVLAAKSGQERYSRIPDEVVRFVLGHFGTPVGEIDPAVRDKVQALPRAGELTMDPVHDKPLDDLRAEQRAKLGRDVDDEELLLRLVMAPDVLEAVRAAGPAPAWNGAEVASAVDGPVESLGDAIRAVNSLPNWRSLEIRLGSQQVRLRRRDDSGHQEASGHTTSRAAR